MNFDLSEEQKLLGEQARSLLAAHASFDRLRSLIDAGAEWDEPLWRQVSEMGLPAAAIPEEYGGLGLGALDLGVISQALGAANAPVPFFSSIVCAAGLIADHGSAAQKSEWLAQLAAGAAVGCLAYAEGPAGWRPETPSVVFRSGRLSGVKTPVADAGVAGMTIVTCEADGATVFALVRLDQKGVTRERLESFDSLRPHYRLHFDQAEAELLGNASGTHLLDTAFDRLAVQQAFEAVGAAEACLFMARDYALQRQIFGRPLASYQAIKHRLADLIMKVELARSNAFYAGWAADGAPQELAAAASAARLTALDAFEMGARENLQIHGGIGYTFEANCHFYYRRERAMAASLGSRQYWADRLIAHLPGTRNEAA